MKKYAPVLLVLLVIAVLLVVFLYYPKNEPTISLNDFKAELNSSKNISIVEDTRNSPSPGALMDCGAAIAGSLGYINPNTIIFENDTCTYSLGYGDTRNISITDLRNRHKDTQNSSLYDCESKFSSTLIFYIEYNAEKNSTSYYHSRAVIEGDNSFLEDCAIARLISS